MSKPSSTSFLFLFVILSFSYESLCYNIPSITKDLFKLKPQWPAKLPSSDEICMSSDVPQITDWRVVKSGAIVGKVKNHPSINDGDTITTSPLQNPETVKEGSVVETVSGSQYNLLKKAAIGFAFPSFGQDLFKPRTMPKNRKTGAPEIEDWRILKSGQVIGVVRNHPLINDGDTITTSELAKPEGVREGKVVMTKSGTKYKLLNESKLLSTSNTEEGSVMDQNEAIGDDNSSESVSTSKNGVGSFSLPSMGLPLPSMTKDKSKFAPPWYAEKKKEEEDEYPIETDLPLIDEWRIKQNGAVVGIVRNHPNIQDGDTITTSSLAEPKAVNEGKIVVTESGSAYRLLNESTLSKKTRKKDVGDEKLRTPRNNFSLSLSFGLPKIINENAVEDILIPEIDQWRLTASGTIAGIVSNHPTIEDGNTLTTSILADVNDVKEGRTITTKSGSKYKLLKEMSVSAKLTTNKKVADRDEVVGGGIKSSLQSGLLPNGKTCGNGKYVLLDEARRTTSGRSQIWTACRADRNGNPVGDLLAIKMTSDFNRLNRESKNYDRITKGLFPGKFVKKKEFLADANGEGFETQSAIVIEAGVKDLKELLNERLGQGLEKKAMRDAAYLAGQCIQAMHSSGMVWTDLKSENFVLMKDVDGDGRLTELKGIDLESAMPVGRNPVDYSPEACPPEFAESFVNGDVAEFLLDPSYDMWSLGMMMFEISTGQPYFRGSDPSVITKQLCSPGFKVDVSNVQDEKLRDLISKCLNTDPKKRPSITQFLLHPYFTTSGIGSFSF